MVLHDLSPPAEQARSNSKQLDDDFDVVMQKRAHKQSRTIEQEEAVVGSRGTPIRNQGTACWTVSAQS